MTALPTIASIVDFPYEVEALFGPGLVSVDPAIGDWIDRLHAVQPDVLLCAPGTIRLDGEALDRLPASIRAIATYSVGTDHLDLDAARERGLAVFHTPGVLTDAVADAAMLLILGAARRTTESIALIRSGTWPGWTPRQLNGVQLRGRRLGILGMGGVGRQIAGRARAFGMGIVYTNRSALLDAGDAEFVPAVPDLIATSDVLVLACPSTPETRHIINASTLGYARPSLILVNVGRGDLIVEEHLIAALSEQRILAAGLDVFEREPAFDPRLLALPNLFMLPHIGSSTIEARLAMGQALVKALGDWTGGKRPNNQIV